MIAPDLTDVGASTEIWKEKVDKLNRLAMERMRGIVIAKSRVTHTLKTGKKESYEGHNLKSDDSYIVQW